MNIYYLTASLPTLKFGGKPVMSLQDFLEQCQRLLAKQEFQLIHSALDDKEDGLGQPTLRAYKNFIRSLRNELAWLRATQQNKDPEVFLNGPRGDIDPAIVDVLSLACEQSDPLSAEKVLDAFIFEKLGELAAQHYFDIDHLIIYGLKLRMLERYIAIESPAGGQKFKLIKTAAAKEYVLS